MYPLVLTLHLLICLSLVGVVLVQSGKGGGLAGGAFGGSAQTVFGGRGATDFFTKATMVLGAAFFITSMALALMSSGNTGRGTSLIQNEARRGANTQPTTAGGQPSPTQAPGAKPAPAGGTPAKPVAPTTAPAPPPSGSK